MEMPSYNHFIITRFNLKQDDWMHDKNNNKLSEINDIWLKKRFDLFEQFCLPSIQSQSNKNFKWLVYFDVDTPRHFRMRIQEIKLSFPNLCPRFIPSMKHLLKSVKSDILEGLTNDNLIITTRLDNDDCLHINFIDCIQKLVKKEKILRGVVDIPNGYCLKIGTQPLLSKTIQFSNAFISYIEPLGSSTELLTVFDRKHPEWAYSTKTYLIERNALWMQIIHDNNISNKIQGILLNDERRIIDFNVKIKIRFSKLSKVDVLWNKCIKAPAYILKKQVKKLCIKMRLVNTFINPNNFTDDTTIIKN